MSTSENVSKSAVKRGRPFGSNAEDTRERLLQAAGRQFNENAYADVSMAKVARSAGMTGAAIYNYFSSKDELFEETVTSQIRRYNDTITKAVSGSGSWKDKFNRLVDAVTPVQRTSYNFPMIGSVVINRLQQEPDQFQEIRDLRNESAEIFRSLVVEGVECGDLPIDTDIAITGDLLMAITAGAMNTVSFYHPSLDDMKPIVDAVKTLLGTRS